MQSEKGLFIFWNTQRGNLPPSTLSNIPKGVARQGSRVGESNQNSQSNTKQAEIITLNNACKGKIASRHRLPRKPIASQKRDKMQLKICMGYNSLPDPYINKIDNSPFILKIKYKNDPNTNIILL